MTPDALRDEVALLLDGGKAHARAKDVLAAFPAERCGERPRGQQHSAWQLLEHARIAQRDLLEYGRNAGWVSPPFPDGYWPKAAKPPDATAWAKCQKAFLADLRACLRIARDPGVDLLAPIPHCGVNWLRELLIVADHNAWHLAQILQLQRRLEA